MNDKFIKKLSFCKNNHEIFVHIADLTCCKNSIKEYRSCLSSYERSEAKKFYPDHLKELYIKSHGILRYILAHYVNRNPADIEFSYSKYQKPFVKGSNIQFNMSHSGMLVGYAISFERQIGIDLEHHDRNINVHELADTVFTQSERDYFNTLNSEQQIKFFYDAWTIKEAIVKANGQGLSYPVDTIEVLSILNKKEKFVFTNEENVRLKRWYCIPLKIGSVWSGALAIESKYATKMLTKY